MSAFESFLHSGDSGANEQETRFDIEDRHEKEIQELDAHIKALLKQCSKSKKSEVEIEGVQMRYVLRAKHLAEIERYDESHPDDDDINNTGNNNDGQTISKQREEEEQRKIENKKAKAKKKKEKKLDKEVERAQLKSMIKDSAGPSLREQELQRINVILSNQGLQVKEVAADGHCMFRSIVEQLKLNRSSVIANHNPQSTTSISDNIQKLLDMISDNSNSDLGVQVLREITANYIRDHRDEYAPFIETDPTSTEFEEYCRKVESMKDAEWGGQVELRAISNAFGTKIIIYSADAPVICMGDEGVVKDGTAVIRLSYHRHFYSLGEHYNSVVVTQTSESI